MNKRFYITILTLLLFLLSNGLQAKNIGKFKKYTQVTDKEVLVESTKGIKILFTAFDNHSIGATYYDKYLMVKLISPDKILNHTCLNGSIYVEELDELMQITTTTNDGLMIKVNKKEFGFSFIDKSNQQEIVVEEDLLVKVVSNEKKLYVGLNPVEEPDSTMMPNL